MLTPAEAKDVLSSNGIQEVPEFEILGWLELLQATAKCLEQYEEARRKLLLGYLLSLFALSRGFKYVSSMHAPSGASIGFRYADTSAAWAGYRGWLRKLDVNHCLDDLIPDTPAKKHVAFMVVGGDCNERHR